MITDSLGLPRRTPEFVALERTWPQLLRNALPGACVYQLSLGGASTDDMLPQLDYLSGQDPAMVIVQAGIVDCAPRAFRRSEIAVLLATRAGRALLNRMERSTIRLLRRIRNVSYVSERQFEKNVVQIANSFTCPVVWLGILGGARYDELVPGITARIAKYNAILHRVLREQFMDLGTILGPEHFMSDAHHLNEGGHCALMRALEQHPSFIAVRTEIMGRAPR